MRPSRLRRFLCGLVGHPHGHRATHIWGYAKEWQPINPSYGVYVCDRCNAVMPGQPGRGRLQFR